MPHLNCDQGDTGSCTPGDPCQVHTTTAADGARLSVLRHGGHLTGWSPAGGPELLWMSPQARCGPGEAVRGGVPVIFPQFSARGPLPKHGLARDRAWDELRLASTDGAATVEAVLLSDDATQAIWPHRFRLTLRARAAGTELALQVSVHNEGSEPFAFTLALHTYLAAWPGSVVQLDGATSAAWVEDNATGATTTELPGPDLDPFTERDVVVRRLDGPVRLAHADGTTLTLTRDGLADLVIWNPGPDHSLGDVPPGSAPFVCLEPAQLDPVELDSGSTWYGNAKIGVVRTGSDYSS